VLQYSLIDETPRLLNFLLQLTNKKKKMFARRAPTNEAEEEHPKSQRLVVRVVLDASFIDERR
jgi:hypothetical protein